MKRTAHFQLTKDDKQASPFEQIQRKNADSGQFSDFIGEKQSVHPSFPALLYLFPARPSFCTVFYGSPSLCLYEAIGKYTTSRLIISQPVERSHFSCVVLTAASKKLLLENSHLFGCHTWVTLRHITCLAQGLEVSDSELWRRPGGLCVSRGGGCKGVNRGVIDIFITRLHSRHLSCRLSEPNSRMRTRGFCEVETSLMDFQIYWCRCVSGAFLLQVEELQDAYLACYAHIDNT